jgi:hypothetical protein
VSRYTDQSWLTAASTWRPDAPKPALRNIRAVASHWGDCVAVVPPPSRGVGRFT